MEKIIRWGILGAGSIAHKFAASLAFVENAKLVAIGSRDIEKAREFAGKYGAEKIFGSYEALASCPDIDVVYVATPHVFHCKNTLLCLENNKAVLCEKPFAMDKPEVISMIEKAREKNLFLMEALWTRFFPSFHKVKELIGSGAIGDIIHLRADFGFKAPYLVEGRLFNKKLGGGSLLDIGIYPVFLASNILGTPDKIITSSIIGKTGIDESIVMNFIYNNGAIASLYSTILTNTSNSAEIFGTNGYIRIPKMWHKAKEIVVGKLDGTEETIQFDYPSYGYEFEAQEVTSCLLEGKKESSVFSLNDSLNLISLLDKIRELNQISYL